MVVETRHRHTPSWTSFDSSPFFREGSKAVDSGSPIKKESESSSTAVTASTSNSTASRSEDRGYPNPTVVKEMNTSRDKQQVSGRSANHRGVNNSGERPLPSGAAEGERTEKSERIKARDPYNDDESNDDDDESEWSDEEQSYDRPKRRPFRRSRRVPLRDACMPFALEDLREIANKAFGVLSHVQKFFYQQLDPEDENHISNRLSRAMGPHPTTIFVVPKGANSKEKSKSRTTTILESLADSLTNPTALEDDVSETLELRTLEDDMSSLTEPPFHLSRNRTLPPLLRIQRMREAASKKATAVVAAQQPIHVNYDENGDEFIEFEPENVQLFEDYDHLNEDFNLPPVAAKSMPSRVPEKAPSDFSEPSMSDRFRTFLPHLASQPKKAVPPPELPSKVQLVWSAEVPKPGVARGAQPPVLHHASDLSSVSC